MLQKNTEIIDRTFDRIPPFNEDAERAAMASLVLCDDPNKRMRLIGRLAATDFFSVDRQVIFQRIQIMHRAGKKIDAITLADDLRNANLLEDIGGMATVGELFGFLPSWHHGEQYISVVLDYSARRRGIKVANELLRKLWDNIPGDVAREQMQAAITELWSASQNEKKISSFTLEDILHQFLEDKEQKKAPALLTGISVLDDYAGVFASGSYTIVAGRPGMGKSTLIRWLLGNWASQGVPVGLIAVEESRHKIAGNYISAQSSVENHVIAYKSWSADQNNRAARAIGGMAKWTWHGIDDAFTLDDVSTAFEMLATEKGCKVIAIDHIHLIQLGRHVESGEREIKEISLRMKELGKRYDVVMIVAAQLSRPMEKNRMPPPPSLTDLRASGAIEEHCDAALMLHREDYYKKGGEKTHQCQVGIEKNRNGETGRCTLVAELSYQRFRAGDPTLGMESPY